MDADLRRRGRAARPVIRRFLIWSAIGIVVGLAALVTVPRAVGVTPFTVLTGSMEPAFAPATSCSASAARRWPCGPATSSRSMTRPATGSW